MVYLSCACLSIVPTSASTIQTCDLPSFEAAVQSGGEIQFGCDATLDLDGATQDHLSFVASQPADRGEYRVVVKNFSGSVTSDVARLSFSPLALKVLLQPQSQAVSLRFPVTFSVLVSGIKVIQYQWLKNEEPIPGATGDTLELDAVRASDLGEYRVRVENGYLTLVSSEAYSTQLAEVVPPNLLVDKAGNFLVLTLAAERGRTYHLASSTDVRIWTDVVSKSPESSGPAQFLEPMSTSRQR